MSTLCHCEREPDYEAKARFEPTVTLDVTPLREPGQWQPEHLADIELDALVEGLVVECQRCGWTEDMPTLVEVGELDWPERLIEILGTKLQTAARRDLFADFCAEVLDDDPEPDAWELLRELQGTSLGHGTRYWMVMPLGPDQYACGPSEDVGGSVHPTGTGPTPEAAIRAAWKSVHQEEAV